MHRIALGLTLAALATALASPFGQAASPVRITIYCDEYYPPYSYAVEGRAMGVYVDIVRAADELMPGYEIDIVPIPWKRGLAMMEAGTGFALFPPYYRPEERPYLDYRVKLFDEEIVLLLCDKNAYAKAEAWPEDFRGATIGVNLGFLMVSRWQSLGIFTVEESVSNENNISKLKAGRIDAYANDKMAVLGTIAMMESRGDSLGCLFVGPTISTEEAFLGITNRDGGRYLFKEDFIARMSEALDRLRASGEFDRLVSASLRERAHSFQHPRP